VEGDPNRGIQIPGTSPDSQQRADQGPGGYCHEGPAPAGKGKGKEPEPELRHEYNVGSIPIGKDDEVCSIPTSKDDEEQGAATTQSSQEHEEARSRRLRHGDGSFVGEPATKHQKTHYKNYDFL
jgi:hypothetical protein